MIIRKVMLLGDIGVGKTSIANRLAFDRWSGDYKATIGVDVYQYEVKPAPLGQPFQFIVWDTDGNFGDTIFRHVYVKQAQAAFVVGDVTRPGTLQSMVRLIEGFSDALPGRYAAYLLNKIDLVAEGERPALPDKLVRPDFPLFRTSAKTGANVQHAFQEAAATIIRRGQ